MTREHELASELRAIRKARRAEAKKQRPANPKATRGRVHDNGYLAFLRRQPCAVGPVGCDGPVEAAHIRFADARRGKPLTGLQTKPDDRWCVNLCAAHHRTGPNAQHGANERAWWEARGIDPLSLAERQYAAYLRGDA